MRSPTRPPGPRRQAPDPDRGVAIGAQLAARLLQGGVHRRAGARRQEGPLQVPPRPARRRAALPGRARARGDDGRVAGSTPAARRPGHRRRRELRVDRRRGRPRGRLPGRGRARQARVGGRRLRRRRPPRRGDGAGRGRHRVRPVGGAAGRDHRRQRAHRREQLPRSRDDPPGRRPADHRRVRALGRARRRTRRAGRAANRRRRHQRHLRRDRASGYAACRSSTPTCAPRPRPDRHAFTRRRQPVLDEPLPGTGRTHRPGRQRQPQPDARPGAGRRGPALGTAADQPARPAAAGGAAGPGRRRTRHRGPRQPRVDRRLRRRGPGERPAGARGDQLGDVGGDQPAAPDRAAAGAERPTGPPARTSSSPPPSAGSTSSRA